MFCEINYAKHSLTIEPVCDNTRFAKIRKRETSRLCNNLVRLARDGNLAPDWIASRGAVIGLFMSVKQVCQVRFTALLDVATKLCVAACDGDAADLYEIRARVVT